jgi:crotonobetainyl-CoA:carnitine CoA-transferase CaiB-like acyl-CoA transferase
MKLDGLRVIDLSRFLPGPILTQFLADHGAEVVKVEAVGEGEPTRHVGETRDGCERVLRQHAARQEERRARPQAAGGGSRR